MITQCKKLVFSRAVNKTLPCINHKGHQARCTPNLMGQRIGEMLILRLGERQFPPSQKKYHKNTGIITWVVEQNGAERIVQHASLSSGMSRGVRIKNAVKLLGHPSASDPEYRTIVTHWHHIFSHNCEKSHPLYRGMPFFDAWNPQKGGLYGIGAKWIVDNLGFRPSSKWSLDIIEHSKGFVPGNLRWALHRSQSLNQQHRLLGQVTDEEFKVEAQKRGYKLI